MKMDFYEAEALMHSPTFRRSDPADSEVRIDVDGADGMQVSVYYRLADDPRTEDGALIVDRLECYLRGAPVEVAGTASPVCLLNSGRIAAVCWPSANAWAQAKIAERGA